jgi:hypothetical protein
MPGPVCPKCGYNVFQGLPYPVVGLSDTHLVSCASCGAAVGVVQDESKRLTRIEEMVTRLFTLLRR